ERLSAGAVAPADGLVSPWTADTHVTFRGSIAGMLGRHDLAISLLESGLLRLRPHPLPTPPPGPIGPARAGRAPGGHRPGGRAVGGRRPCVRAAVGGVRALPAGGSAGAVRTDRRSQEALPRGP